MRCSATIRSREIPPSPDVSTLYPRPSCSSDSAFEANDATLQEDTWFTRVGLFSLPREIREMIHHYYYGPVESRLQYYCTSESPPMLLRRSAPTPWLKNLFIPETSLHQVCKFIAREAKPIWHNKTSRFALEGYDAEHAIPDFLRETEGLLSGLKSRLISLAINTEIERPIQWLTLLQASPKLKLVDFICSSRDADYHSPEGYPETTVSNAMNEDPDWKYELLYCYDLVGLAWALKQLSRRDCRVTGTTRETVYAGASSAYYLDPDTPYLYQSEIKFMISPDGVTSVSKSCITAQGLRGRWSEGTAKPMIAEAGSEEWEEMKLSSVGDEDTWVLP